MPLPASGPDTRLREEHAQLDARFDDLCARARGGEWCDVDEMWNDFAADLESHLSFEEKEVFPVVAAAAPSGGALVDRLLAQHAMIRARLDELGVEIQLHLVRAETIDGFVETLRAHAELEAKQLYPFVEARLSA